MNDIENATTESAPRGWPKGKPRKPQIETPDAFLDEIQGRVTDERARMDAARDASPANTARSGQRNPQRLKREALSDDPLDIPAHLIPDGMSYEWKRSRIGGQPDKENITKMMRQHWTPVPAERHPSLAWADSTSRYIEKDSLILMERPRYLTDEAQAERIDASEGAVRNQFRKLQGDSASRDYDRASVKTGFVVDDDE